MRVSTLARRLVGSRLARARAPHQRLERLVQVVLLEAGAAVGEVLADAVAVGLAHLVVEELVDPVERLGALGLQRGQVALEALGHDDAPPSRSDEPTPAAARPRSRA
ncbi:hypothetical protein GCM10025868_38010 [Angustibacter aerolatus]|uniref:Uncharacterized protein n=1 Tax=Angustibacter aerolatus TaxID=1162965 RepID=A0ABQ6JPF7_9ACTN|nr:hypothetical protein GCM10025868_38010 [Angustibacter aerolatus]